MKEWVHINTAAEILGIHPETIRRWERAGLISPQRDDNGHRIFKRKDLRVMYYRCYGKRDI